MRILLIEDDHVLGEAIRDHLRASGHATDWVRRLDDAEAALFGVRYELMLLDLNLPDGRGLDLLRRLRGRGEALPVIITTAQDQIAVRIEGLNAGADDYLVKPFDLSEMTARINAVARRSVGQSAPLLRLGPVEIDLAHRIVKAGGETVTLSAREWAVMERLVARPGAIVTKAEIEESLYAFGAEIESNAVEVYVSRLRKKLGRDLILTVRGLGYQAVA
ncbi:response regulator transcription factor [Devosia sp. PTR5]|uniref:Response regulator transcription factor n=1 Tax=Devosia oryzisoli TaxID=2774138 RepID=A0A927FW28_9HYPH|nr:response regulator transcription factor [Devosia oryzisoli]MBD8066577.1 response regulator transcription factor [Devosia oryzisoli]